MDSLPNIYTFIAYDTEKNLGRAYNSCMDLLDDDDWVVFIDHDAMFVQKDWYKNVSRIIKENPEYGFFTCFTNRIGCPWQLVPDIDRDNHDIKYHYLIGRELEKITEKEEVVDVTNDRVLSGVVMITQKKVWKKIGGAKDGFLSVDNDLHMKCKANGIKVGFIRSLYVYHWYRAEKSVENLDKLCLLDK